MLAAGPAPPALTLPHPARREPRPAQTPSRNSQLACALLLLLSNPTKQTR